MLAWTALAVLSVLPLPAGQNPSQEDEPRTVWVNLRPAKVGYCLELGGTESSCYQKSFPAQWSFAVRPGDRFSQTLRARGAECRFSGCLLPIGWFDSYALWFTVEDRDLEQDLMFCLRVGDSATFPAGREAANIAVSLTKDGPDSRDEVESVYLGDTWSPYPPPSVSALAIVLDESGPFAVFQKKPESVSQDRVFSFWIGGISR
jgi:hypothetical protein